MASAADCKSADFGLRWFESNPTHLSDNDIRLREMSRYRRKHQESNRACTNMLNRLQSLWRHLSIMTRASQLKQNLSESNVWVVTLNPHGSMVKRLRHGGNKGSNPIRVTIYSYREFFMFSKESFAARDIK